MYRRVVLLLLVVLVAAPSTLLANPTPVFEPSWFATPPLAPPRTPIALVLSNTSPDTIQIGSTAPWSIVEDDYTTVVYQPPFVFWWAIEIPPGGSLTWHWTQQNNAGHQVDAGTYYGKISWWYADEGAGNSHTSYARIDIFGGALWAASPKVVPDDSVLALTLTNEGPNNIVIRDTDPWFIRDQSGMTVYDPGGSTTWETMGVGETRAWEWDLADNGGAPVDPGDYVAVVDYYDSSGNHRYRDEDQFSVIASEAGDVMWVVEPPVNSTQSVVALTMTNATGDTIWINDTAPWHIEDEGDTTVYTPWACFVVVPVPPGGTWTWAWDERDDYSDYVEEGLYTAVLGFSQTPIARADTRDTKEFDFYLGDPIPEPPCVFVESDSFAYAWGETVGFTFANCTIDTVGMTAMYTWWITNQAGFPVYWPFVLCAHTEFAPGEDLYFRWDQTDVTGNQVPGGTYYAAVEFTDEEYLTRYVVYSNPVVIPDASGVPDTPAAGHLGQSFPNPTRQATTISYTLTKRGPVTLEIYNVAGRLVRMLVDEVQEPNESGYVVDWDGTDQLGRGVPSGVYFYRLITDAASLTKKLVLIQ